MPPPYTCTHVSRISERFHFGLKWQFATILPTAHGEPQKVQDWFNLNRLDPTRGKDRLTVVALLVLKVVVTSIEQIWPGAQGMISIHYTIIVWGLYRSSMIVWCKLTLHVIFHYLCKQLLPVNPVPFAWGQGKQAVREYDRKYYMYFKF